MGPGMERCGFVEGGPQQPKELVCPFADCQYPWHTSYRVYQILPSKASKKGTIET